MTERIAETLPRFKARIVGVLYFLTILTGIFADVFVRGRLVESGDAAATAANILAHQPLYRLGFACALVATACYVAVTALFYNLFEPVSRTRSLLAAFFSLVGCAIQAAFNCLVLLAPLVLLGNGHYLSVFKAEQLQALTLMFLKLRAQAHTSGMVFYGLYGLLIGYLIFRSTFLPRILGMLLVLGGLGYLTFLSPPLANDLYPYNLVPGALGGVSLMLWLLVVGVNVQRWNESARTAGFVNVPST
jgi:hypothetical protein